jgi:hypothetical protein
MDCVVKFKLVEILEFPKLMYKKIYFPVGLENANKMSIFLNQR